MSDNDFNDAQSDAHTRLARLFLLQIDYEVPAIAMVLTHEPHIQSNFLAEHDASIDMQTAVQKNLSAAWTVFGDPKENTTLDDQIADSVSKNDPKYCSMRREFDRWFELLEADRRNFRDVEIDELREYVRWPTWSYETFAALSFGKRRSLNKLIENGLLLAEFTRRIAKMESAGELPEGHEGFLRPVATPRECMEWATKGDRFDLHPILKPFCALPSYRELEEQLRLALSASDENANAIKLGAETKRVRSLQRICMTLVACIQRVPTGVAQPPVWDPDKRSKFVGGVRNYAEQILGKDVPSDETVRDHLIEAYNQLSEDAQQNWNELRSKR